MINVGDVVIPNPNHPFHERFQLASGCGYYEFAICVSVEPFILVSEHADMLWQATIANKEHYFIGLCQAHPDIVAKCMTRIPDDLRS